VRRPVGALWGARFETAFHRLLPAVAGGVLALGMLLRVRQYVAQRSLWLDELSVALNLASRDFLDLLRPLDYNQSAPVLFLWAQELATRLGGLGELTLRFVPLMCGIALLPVAWLAARRLLQPWAAVCAVLLLAVSPLLVWHANEVKPYAGDALASAAMLVLALRTLDAPTDWLRWRALAVGGVVALLGSTPSLFVLGGVALAIALEPGVRRDRTAVRRAAVTVVSWGAVFTAVYLAVYRPVARSGFMQRYWGDEFLRFDLSLPGTIGRAMGRLLEVAFLPYLDGVPLHVVTAIAGALLVVGAAHTARRHGLSRAALLVAPLLLVFAASLLRRYPLEPRLLLFAVPPLALLLLEGLAAFEPRRLPALRLAAFAALFGFHVLSAGWRLLKVPIYLEESREVVEVYQRRANGDPVLVFGHGIKSWAYYTSDSNQVDSLRIRWAMDPARELSGPNGLAYRGALPGAGTPAVRGWERWQAERTRQLASPCAWLFFAHFREPQIDTLISAIVNAGGSVRQEAVAPGAALHRACFDPNMRYD
jgi:hypothetical protein